MSESELTDDPYNDDPFIVLEHLSKSFDHRHRSGKLEVLKDIQLKIYPKDMIAIMGKSGAGKSTLLQIMGALDTPTGGRYLFDGEDVFGGQSSGMRERLFGQGAKTRAKFRNEKIGFVFQSHHLLPEFTAAENVMMPGLIARQDQTKVRQRALQLLDVMGLSERSEHRPGELSGGEQQRVAIARALFTSPKLLLADELTGNLDMKTSADIHKVLKRVNDEFGVTILVVTHDPRLAERMPVQLWVDDGYLLPFEPGDERVGSRLPDEFLHKEPTSARPLEYGSASE